MHLDPIGAAVPENYVRVSYLIGISRGCYEGLELSCADLSSTASDISHDPVNSATPWQVDLEGAGFHRKQLIELKVVTMVIEIT